MLIDDHDLDPTIHKYVVVTIYIQLIIQEYTHAHTIITTEYSWEMPPGYHDNIMVFNVQSMYSINYFKCVGSMGDDIILNVT